MRPGSATSAGSIGSTGPAPSAVSSQECDELRRGRRSRNKEKVAELLGDEARVAALLQQHLVGRGGGVGRRGHADEAPLLERDAHRSVHKDEKVLPESVIRERLRVLALQAEGLDDDAPGRGALVSRLTAGGREPSRYDVDLRDIETGDVVHNAMIADIETAVAPCGFGAKDVGQAGRQRRAEDAATAEEVLDHQLRPGPGGLLQRRDAPAGGDGGGEGDEVVASERRLEDEAYLRLLSSADTRPQRADQGAAGADDGVWRPGGSVRDAFLRKSGGHGVEDAAEEPWLEDKATGLQHLEAEVRRLPVCCLSLLPGSHASPGIAGMPLRAQAATCRCLAWRCGVTDRLEHGRALQCWKQRASCSGS